MSVTARGSENRVPFLRTSNVLWDRIDLTTVDEMSISPHELTDRLVEPGDLLVCEGGAIGRAAIWEGAVAPMSFQNHVHRLRPKIPDLEPRFYVFFLQSAFTQLGIFEGAGNKTTIPNLSSSRLSALKVPHPSLTEQRAIVNVLSQVREADKLHGALSSLAHDLKRAAMERVFRRGLAEYAQVESPIGPVPEGWIVEPLAATHTVKTGRTPSRTNQSYWVNGSIPWVKTAEVSYYSTIVETAEHITEAAIRETAVTLFPPGTLLLAMYGQGATRGKIAKLGIEAGCNQACAAIRSDGGAVDTDYLYFFLDWQYEAIRNRAHGGQQQNLNLDIVRNIPIAYPSDLSEQLEIAAILGAIDNKVTLHSDRTTVSQELFNRLLRGLMTSEFMAEDFVVGQTTVAADEAA